MTASLTDTRKHASGDQLPLGPACASAFAWRPLFSRPESAPTSDLCVGWISYEEFHPYGSTAFRAADSGVEVPSKRYRYSGKERDEETGLYYYGARYYPPWLGRWTACDPKERVENTYEFCAGRPVTLVDRDGREEKKPVSFMEKIQDAFASSAPRAEQATKTAGPIEDPAPGGIELSPEAKSEAMRVSKTRELRRKEIAGDLKLGIGPGTVGYGSSESIAAKIALAKEAAGKKDSATSLLWYRRAAREAMYAEDPSVDPATMSVAPLPGADAAITSPVLGLRDPEVIVAPMALEFGNIRSVVLHESVHVHQYRANPLMSAYGGLDYSPKFGNQKPTMGEVEAYGRELSSENRLRLTPQQAEDMRMQLRKYWDNLDPAHQKRVRDFIPSDHFERMLKLPVAN